MLFLPFTKAYMQYSLLFRKLYFIGCMVGVRVLLMSMWSCKSIENKATDEASSGDLIQFYITFILLRYNQ